MKKRTAYRIVNGYRPHLFHVERRTHFLGIPYWVEVCEGSSAIEFTSITAARAWIENARTRDIHPKGAVLEVYE